MDINFLENGIFINQSDYTKKILQKFGFSQAYEASTPMDPGIITERLIDDQELKEVPVREIVGSLLYLSTISRPDISFSVNFLSRHVNKPKFVHWKIIQRIFRYLRGTIEYGIFYPDERSTLTIYSDANYGGDITDLNSTNGVLVEFGGPIVWISQKQKATSISSAESEYRAAVVGIQEAC